MAQPKNTRPQFLDVHMLRVPPPGVLLNRDDSNFAKDCRYGGEDRIRVSSQCEKRHLRLSDLWTREPWPAEVGEVKDSIRTSPDRLIGWIVDAIKGDVGPEAAQAAASGTVHGLLGMIDAAAKKDKARAKSRAAHGEDTNGDANGNGDDAREIEAKQLVFWGEPERQFLSDEAKKVAAKGGTAAVIQAAAHDNVKVQGPALRGLVQGRGLGVDLFGRMSTGDILARADAATYWGGSFTVHARESWIDRLTAIDDLASEDSGRTHTGLLADQEQTSGVFYQHFVIDVAQLVSNRTGCNRRNWRDADRAGTAEVVRRLIWVAYHVTAAAKLGSTAPSVTAAMCLVEVHDLLPRSAAGAFFVPVPKAGALDAAYTRLAEFFAMKDAAEGPRHRALTVSEGNASRLLRIGSLAPGCPMPLDDLVRWVKNCILEA